MGRRTTRLMLIMATATTMAMVRAQTMTTMSRMMPTNRNMLLVKMVLITAPMATTTIIMTMTTQRR